MPFAKQTRHFNPIAAQAAILAENLPFLESAEDFLRRYGGMHLTRYAPRQCGLNNPKVMAQVEVAHFNPIRTIANIDCRWFSEYAKRIGKPVTPIGECSQGHASLMIDGEGAVYAGYDDCLGKIANSPEEAILDLVDRTRRGYESIPKLETEE